LGLVQVLRLLELGQAPRPWVVQPQGLVFQLLAQELELVLLLQPSLCLGLLAEEEQSLVQ
jgi:hypothetical protein